MKIYQNENTSVKKQISVLKLKKFFGKKNSNFIPYVK